MQPKQPMNQKKRGKITVVCALIGLVCGIIVLLAQLTHLAALDGENLAGTIISIPLCLYLLYLGRKQLKGDD